MSSPRVPDTSSVLSGWLPQIKDTVRRAIRARFARDVAALQVSNSAQKMLAVVFWVVLYRLLSPEEIGQYVHVLAFFGTINLLGYLSLGPSLVTRLAEAAAAHDAGELRRIMGYLTKINAAWALPATALTWLVAVPLSVWWYGVPLYGELVQILVLGAPLAVLTIIMTTALQSASRMHSIALVEVCAKTTQTLLGVGAMLVGLGVAGLVSATVISQAVGCAIGLLAYQRVLHRHHTFASLPAVVATAITVPWRAYFRFSALALVDKNIAALFERTPLLLIGRFMPPEQALLHAAFYDAARKVLSFLAIFHGAVARKLRAALGERTGQVGLSGARSVFWRVTLLWTPLALAIAAGLVVCLPLFRLALTPDVFPSLTLVIIFALHTGLMGLGVGFGSVFLLTDRIGLNIAIKTPINLACLPLGALLVMQWGAEGAALYMLAAYSVGYVAYLSLLASNWFWQTGARPPTAANQPVSA